MNTNKMNLAIGQQVYSETLDEKRTVFGVVVGYGREWSKGVDVRVEFHRTHDGKRCEITTDQSWWKPFGKVVA